MQSMIMRCVAAAALWLACSGIAQGQGRALQFDGNDDHVTATLPAVFDDIGSTDFTITTRVRIDQAGATQRILFAQKDTSNYVSLLVNSLNRVYAYVGDSGGDYSLRTSGQLAIGQWSEVTLRWTAASNNVELIVDGTAATIDGDITSFAIDGVLALGARTDGMQVLDGTLDDLAIWPTALGDAELATVWSGLCLSGATPVVRYDFEVGQAGGTNTGLTTLPDLGSSGSDGTLLGFALAGNTSNWVASPYVPCGQPTAVSLTVSDVPDPVAAGASVTWSADIAVAGAPASAVLLAGEVPVGVAFASLAAPAGMACTTPAVGASGAISCATALLPVGTTSVTVVADVPADAVPNALVEANWSVSAVGDSDATDNDASATTTIANQLLLLDDSATTPFAQPIAIDVLANDGVAAGGAALDASTLQVSSGPANGAASCTVAGCSYLPGAMSSGVDGFSYTVCDGSATPVCGTAAVRVVVGPAAVDDAFAPAQGTALASTVAANDVFPASSQFSVQAPPSAGTLVLDADGSFSYMPAPGYAGADSFDYQLCLPAPDAAVCATATVSLTVTATPLLLSPASGALPAAVVASPYPGVTFGASGGTAPYVFALIGGALPPGLALNATGALSGTPTASGNFAFTVQATDSSSGSGPFQVAAAYSVEVAQATQAITFAPLADFTGTEGDTLQVDPVASSGLPVLLASSTLAVCTVSGTGPFLVTLVGSGTCTLVASQPGDANTAAAADVIVSFGVGVSPRTPPPLPQPAVIPTLERSWQLLLALMLVMMGGVVVRRRN